MGFPLLSKLVTLNSLKRRKCTGYCIPTVIHLGPIALKRLKLDPYRQ